MDEILCSININAHIGNTVARKWVCVVYSNQVTQPGDDNCVPMNVAKGGVLPEEEGSVYTELNESVDNGQLLSFAQHKSYAITGITICKRNKSPIGN